MNNLNSFVSLLVVSFVSLLMMGCPNSNRKSSDIAEVGSYGDRSQILFAGTRLDSAIVEQIQMPYAVGQLYRGYNNQLLMSLYFFESDISAGGNPCFNLNLINNQNYQRSFTVQNLDYANRTPQVVYGNYNGTSVYFNYVPAVYFQATDRTRNVSLLEQNFNGTITVLESSFEGALVRFDSVTSTQNCYRTPENRTLACGARISGQIRVPFCL